MQSDVTIVGAGPAGLFAAKEIANNSKLKVLVIDVGKDVKDRVCPVTNYKSCTKCNPCSILCGVGGAGTLSSGLLNLRPDIGGNLTKLVKNEKEAWDLVEYVDNVFLRHGAPNRLYSSNKEMTEGLERKAAATGIKFIPIVQRHIGTDKAPKVILSIKNSIENMGVKLLLRRRVVTVDCGKLVLKNGENIKSKYILLAPGRVGGRWLAKESKRLNIPTQYQPIDIGVRVEVPAVIMEPIAKINLDPKFHIYSDTYDDFVRTFCTNHKGFVVQEMYDSFVGVNGHAMNKKKSKNSNFALLVKVGLTEPLEDTMTYGMTVATQTTTLGGGKPILQKLGDLQRGNRSTWNRITKGHVQPTLRSVTPGDVSMGLPHRIVTDLLESLEKLDNVMPGVASSSSLLYAPEVKFSANKICTNNDFETPVENVFVAGDGAGLSGGLVIAAATGVLAARGILRKEGIEISIF